MKKAFRIFRIVLLALCVAVFLASAVMLVDILVGYGKADNFYDDINKGVEDADTPDAEAGKAPARLVELSKYVVELQKTYPDVVGYVNVPSLGISYPVVQADDNDYYLDHLIRGEENSSGSIFLDYRADTDPQKAQNTVLYGHNMNDGSMFHKVEKFFTDKSLFDGAVVEYVTEDGVYIYEPWVLYRCWAGFPFGKCNFAEGESFVYFCEDIIEEVTSKAFYYLNDLEYDEDSSIITFATCVNSITTKNDRYIYQAMLKEAYVNIHAED